MAGLFEINVEDIKRLDALQLTILLECLVSNELADSGVRRTNGYTSLDIMVPDGGADGFVEINSEAIPKMDHILASVTVFQAKSGHLSSAKFVSELFIKDSKPKRLKPRIEEALKKSGYYIVFYSKTCKFKEKAEAAMQEAVELAYPEETLKVKIFDCSDIVRWTNRYLPAIIRVSKWAGRTAIAEFIAWDNLSGYAFFGNEFVSDDHAAQFVSQVRAEFIKPRQSLRLIGQSGLGKTRLVLEAFRPPKSSVGDPDPRILSNSMVYAYKASSENVVSVVRQLRDHEISEAGPLPWRVFI
jgi:hypothetical protein